MSSQTEFDTREAQVVGSRPILSSGPGSHGSGALGPIPNLSPPSNTHGHSGSLLRGAVDDDGKLKAAGLCVGIKLDLEAEIHLTARVRGDIIIGLY